jgi:predicted SnoaL-like aldol condensation-catalyzing enzyme
MLHRLIILAIFVGTPIISLAQTNASQLEANKKLAEDFFKSGALQHPEGVADKFLAPDYVQHNPRFVQFDQEHHPSGKEGFVQAIKSGILAPPHPPGEAAPPPPPPRTEAFAIAEGDLVTIVWKQPLPDPSDKSKTYEAFTFDAFRVKNGKFVEHWDGAMLPPGGPPRN